MAATDERTAAASEADGSRADPGVHDEQGDHGDTRHGRLALWLVIAAWAGLLVALLRHREVLSSDTLSNYVHVWFLQDAIWRGHTLPIHMPVLGHGRAFTFPYAFIPWMFSALLWPIFGEFSVGIALGAGWLFMALGTFYAFPELKRGWWAAGVLLSPALLAGILLGQLPFLWAAGMFLVAIASWRRGRRKTAVVFAALAQITHAAILMPLVGLFVLWRLRAEPAHRRALLTAWLVSVVPALPAAYIVFASPVTSETSPLISLWIEIETLALRSLFLLVPLALIHLKERGDRRAPALAFAGLVLFQVAVLPVTSLRMGWGAIGSRPDAASTAIGTSAHVQPGKVYRVLSWGDRKWAPYAVVRRGGTLDSELFPESLHWRSFADERAYALFLTKRSVDVVLIQSKYNRFKTNEQALLDAMSAQGRCVDGVAVSTIERGPQYAAYAITRGCAAPPR